MARGNGFQSPTTSPKDAAEETIRAEDVETRASMLSPGFLSAAAMAGWDEEALLLATIIVEDTPERESKHKRRLGQPFRTPPSTTSRRKRRSQRQTPPSVAPIGPIILDDDKEDDKEKRFMEVTAVEEEKKEGDQGSKSTENSKSDRGSSLPCMDRLREELSCAICLDICFEPSTTSCGHSFCKKCLKSAADKCGKRCPKCRQLISNGRSCTVNTVLWNTIQLLFPEEIEARKAAMAATNNRETKDRSPKNAGDVTRSMNLDYAIDSNGSRRTRWNQHQVNTSSTVQNNVGRRRTRWDLSQQEDPVVALSNNNSRRRRRRTSPDPEDDEALALRLQREEFMGDFGETHSFTSARANLRAMASTFGGTREDGQPSSSSIAARADQRAVASAFGETHERRRQPTSSFISARENLRAMASRAISLRLRGHPT